MELTNVFHCQHFALAIWYKYTIIFCISYFKSISICIYVNTFHLICDRICKNKLAMQVQKLISISQDDSYNIGPSIQCLHWSMKEICFSGGQFTNPVMLWLSWRELIGKPCPGAASIAPRTSPRHGGALWLYSGGQSYILQYLSSPTLYLPSPSYAPLALY